MRRNAVGRCGTPMERFMRKVEVIPFVECWLWSAGIDGGGYGSFGDGIRVVCAHRWLWEQTNGPIPHGMELDHLCRVRNCVRPSHLEPVTRRINVLRGMAQHAIKYRNRIASGVCESGHPLTEWHNGKANSNGYCQTCKRMYVNAYRARFGRKRYTTTRRTV